MSQTQTKLTQLLTILSSLALTACAPVPDMEMQKIKREAAPVTIDRVTVTQIGVIKDEAAYAQRRGVYVILDNKTGREFIGVSGVGIAETGHHQAGKSVVIDER